MCQNSAQGFSPVVVALHTHISARHQPSCRSGSLSRVTDHSIGNSAVHTTTRLGCGPYPLPLPLTRTAVYMMNSWEEPIQSLEAQTELHRLTFFPKGG